MPIFGALKVKIKKRLVKIINVNIQINLFSFENELIFLYAYISDNITAMKKESMLSKGMSLPIMPV